MAPSITDLQLTYLSSSSGGRKTSPITATQDSGDHENVRLLDSYERNHGLDGVQQGMRRIQVSVSGMTCAACSNSVEAALKGVEGVITASVALLQNKADVVYNPSLVKVSLNIVRGLLQTYFVSY